MQQPELILEAKAALGEGPLWSEREQALFWVDIESCAVHCFDPTTRSDRAVTLDGKVGTVVERAQGGLAVAYAHGFAGLDFATGRVERWCHPERDLPRNRFNDGKCDARGRFWAGTMGTDAVGKSAGALYRLGSDRTVTRLFGDVGCSNGIAWSADQVSMYYIDTVTAQIAVFPFDLETGALGERAVALPIDVAEHGWPDGMCIDAEGMLWSCHWGGWRINRWNPRDGRLLETLRLPVAQVTSCAFGGKDLRDLYITTASVGLNEQQRREQPLAGALFHWRSHTPGVPSNAFAG